MPDSSTAGSEVAQAQLSIVIPARDEQEVIGRCLAALRRGMPEGFAQVVVVANGCRDATAEVARTMGAHVVELPQGSKAAALNAGDAACSVFPRMYLDADIEVAGVDLLALARELPADQPLVGSTGIRFAVDGASPTVRAFYRVFRELPYATAGLVGLGLYALSEAGRARFDAFPEITADDLYVQRLFAPAERRVLSDRDFMVRVPRTLRALLAVRTRAARGRTTLSQRPGAGTAFASSTANTARSLAQLVCRRPWRIGDAAVYAAVNAVAHRRAKRTSGGWVRDPTTR